MIVYIEKLVDGGKGLAHTDRGVVLVDGVLAHETTAIELYGKTGAVPVASVKEVIAPSPHRVRPSCRYFNRCGGCAWQYIAYEEQLRCKHDILIESLQRIGKIHAVPPIETIASPPWNYRHRCQFKMDPKEKRAGFYHKKSHEVIGVEECPLLVPQLNAVLQSIRATVSRNEGFACNQIKCITGTDGTVATSPLLPGYGVESTRITVGTSAVTVFGDSFFQSNRFLYEKMGAWAAPHVGGNFFIDMYGGHGLFSLCLGSNFSSGLLVESAAGQGEQANKDFTSNGYTHIRALSRSAEDFFGNLPPIPPVDLLIVDPPRHGLGRTVRTGIGRLKPETVLYVSCNPSTLARDCGFLTAHAGYSIDTGALFDCSPHTPHIETVLLLRRK